MLIMYSSHQPSPSPRTRSARATFPVFQAVFASRVVVALAHPRDTNRQSVTIICSVDIAYHAKTLSSLDRFRAWQKCAICIHNLGGIAKEGLAWVGSHILDKHFSYYNSPRGAPCKGLERLIQPFAEFTLSEAEGLRAGIDGIVPKTFETCSFSRELPGEQEMRVP
jgi:hypothetical protein